MNIKKYFNFKIVIGLSLGILSVIFLMLTKNLNLLLSLLFPIVAGVIIINMYIKIFKNSRKKIMLKNFKNKNELENLNKPQINDTLNLVKIQKKYSIIMILLVLWLFIIAHLLVSISFEPKEFLLKLILILLFTIPSIYCYKKRLEIFVYKSELNARGMFPFPKYLPEFKWGVFFTITGIIIGLGVMFFLITPISNGTLKPTIMLIIAFFLLEYIFIIGYIFNWLAQHRIKNNLDND